MQYAFHLVPANSPEAAAEELNRFLRGHRALSVTKELVGGRDNPAWAFCVEYLERAPLDGGGGDGRRENRIDYKQVLSPEDFAVFSRLREVRKALAEKAAVPPYAVFTNEQLAALATQRPASAAAMEKIEGVGPARMEKFGAAVLAALTEASTKP